MPNSWITKSDATEIRLAHPHNRAGMASGERERIYDLINDPRLQHPEKSKVAKSLRAIVQEDLTTRIKVSDLPDDDEDKTVDPLRGELMFWEGVGANKELVSRATIVEDCVWDGERYVFAMRRAR